MAEEIEVGTTDRSIFVFVLDGAQTDGSGKTGLVAANLTVSYSRMETDNDATVTDVTSSLSDLGALTTAHTDWGWKEISSTLAPGLYRLDVADALFASGAWYAVVYVMITTSAASASPKEFILTTDTTIQDIVDGVLDEAIAGHNTAGTVGKTIIDIPTDADLVTALADLPTNAELATALATADDAVLTAVGDLPTNAELATALGTADDAVLAAIAALNNLSQANIRTAVGLGSANLDTQLGDLPTNAELATALGTADDAVLSAIAALNNLSAAQVNAEVVDALATDTYAEPTGVPAATASLAAKIGRLHQALRNKVTVTASKKQFFDDADAALWEKDLSDDATTYTESEGNAP